MNFFQDPFVLTGLMLGVVVVLAKIIHMIIPPLRTYQIPISITAGLVGLCLGPSMLDILPFDLDTLKAIVYHGLALVFITMGLKKTPKGASTPDVLSMAFGISLTGALQGVIGVGIILGLGLAIGEALHPGLGLLLPLGFNQGPGQALTFGSSWEVTGLKNGGDIGIIIASLGFAWAIFIGIPLVIYGRKKGWLKRETFSAEGVEEEKETLKDLVEYIALLAGVYFLTYLLLQSITSSLVGREKLVTMIWGLHFVFALFVAFAVRFVINKTPYSQHISESQLGQLANLIVDITTCAALTAIQITVLQENLLPIALITTAGGVVTLLIGPWMASRSFQKDPFCHLVIWFGASTGTLPMGLALVRMIDPKLSSTAPTSLIRGVGIMLVLSVPLLSLMTYAVSQWPDGYPKTGWIVIGSLGSYSIILLLLWRFVGKLRFSGKGWWLKEDPEGNSELSSNS